MIIDRYGDKELHDAFGIEMSSIEGVGVGAGWGRVSPGRTTDPHQHDEAETFVIVRGTGELTVDGARHAVSAGTVAQFEPFETHVLTNVGADDLIFATFYWRDPARAVVAAKARGRRRFQERPLFVFSTPPTPNGDLHLGHLSGPYLGADVFVRFQRMSGAQAWHLTGSDAYQSYVVARARADDRTEAATAAHFSAEIAETLRLMDIELDQYTVTNEEPGYREAVQAYFSALVSSGGIAKRTAPALYDARTGDYLYEVDVGGGCPGCGAPTRGNICEECGEPNLCVDLGEARSALSPEPPRIGEATRFTLRLHEFRDAVAEHHRLGRVPARLRELAERVFRRERLDVPVSHPASWGIPPVESPNGEVVWVWPEMAFGFLFGIEALGRRLGRQWKAHEPEPEWKIVHFFGYDNSFYHSILYPVLYGLAYPEWKPDIDYHVNEFYLLDNDKFSTSRRHAVWGKDVLAPETVDAVRFYLSSTRPEAQRTNFDRADFTGVVEETLIGSWQGWLSDLGQRIDGRYEGQAPDAGNWTPEHTAFLAHLGRRLGAVTDALGQDGFSLRRAVAELEGIVADVRRFSATEAGVAENELWSGESRTAVALELAAALLLARCSAPVMPRFAAAVAEALGTPDLSTWPLTVELVSPGARVDLARRTYFASEPAHRAADPSGA